MTISAKLQHIGAYNNDSGTDLHQHPGCELVVVASGRCQISIPERDWSAMGVSGSLFILPGREPHIQKDFGQCRTAYLSSADIGSFFATHADCIGLGADSDRILAWFEDCHALFLENDPAAQSLFHCICQRIARIRGDNEKLESYHPALKNAIAYIHAHPHQNVDNKQLAQHVGVSPSYLLALFRKTFNCGPRAWQIQQRIQQAKQLLSDPYLSIDEIAQRCGYEDALYFSRQFKKNEGLAPSQWRKQ